MPDPSHSAAPVRSFTAEDFVEFFERRGRDTVVGTEHLWYESATCCYQSFPYHRLVRTPSEAVRPVFRRPRALAVRFPSAPGARGATGDLFNARPPFAIDALSSNTRSRVRRGLRQCVVERVRPAELREPGVALVASTAARQRTRFGRRQSDDWQAFCDAADAHPSWEAWTARVDGRLAALALCFSIEDCYQISTVRSDAELLGAYPNNALIATILGDALTRPGVELACYGMGSLDRGTQGLHDFKLSMGFAAEPITDNIVTRWPVPKRPAAWAADRLTAGTPSHRAAQIATALRSVSGRRSLD